MGLEDEMYFDCTKSNIEDAKRKVKIAENFAIGFVQWCLKEENNIYFETKELLEIYKKTL